MFVTPLFSAFLRDFCTPLYSEIDQGGWYGIMIYQLQNEKLRLDNQPDPSTKFLISVNDIGLTLIIRYGSYKAKYEIVNEVAKEDNYIGYVIDRVSIGYIIARFNILHNDLIESFSTNPSSLEERLEN